MSVSLDETAEPLVLTAGATAYVSGVTAYLLRGKISAIQILRSTSTGIFSLGLSIAYTCTCVPRSRYELLSPDERAWADTISVVYNRDPFNAALGKPMSRNGLRVEEVPHYASLMSLTIISFLRSDLSHVSHSSHVSPILHRSATTRHLVSSGQQEHGVISATTQMDLCRMPRTRTSWFIHWCGQCTRQPPRASPCLTDRLLHLCHRCHHVHGRKALMPHTRCMRCLRLADGTELGAFESRAILENLSKSSDCPLFDRHQIKGNAQSAAPVHLKRYACDACLYRLLVFYSGAGSRSLAGLRTRLRVRRFSARRQLERLALNHRRVRRSKHAFI